MLQKIVYMLVKKKKQKPHTHYVRAQQNTPDAFLKTVQSY